MSASTADDELLIILLRNLRNTAATFGDNSKQYTSIRNMVQGHLKDMKQKGVTTNLTQARQDAEHQMQGVETTNSASSSGPKVPDDLSQLIETLAALGLESTGAAAQ